MELNEMHTEHEHATTSLKVVLLVFAIVLVGALAYLVWATNTAPDTTDNLAAIIKTTTVSTADWKTFTASSEISIGLTFKYPPTYTVDEDSSGKIVVKDDKTKIIMHLTQFSADYTDTLNSIADSSGSAVGWFEKTPTRSSIIASRGTSCTKLSGIFGATTYWGNAVTNMARTGSSGYTLICVDAGTFIANFYDNGDMTLRKNFESLVGTLHTQT